MDFSALAKIDWTAMQTLVTAAGIGFVVYQVAALASQLRLQADSLRSSVYRGVSDSMMRINNAFAERTSLRQYFYDDVAPPEEPAEDDQSKEANETRDLIVRLDNLCEVILDFADDVIEQADTMRVQKEMDWSTWWAYLRSLYQNSPVLREFMRTNLEYYPDYTHAYFGHILVRGDFPSPVRSRLMVFELVPNDDEASEADRERFARATEVLGGPPELPGHDYPWYRTWFIERADRTACVIVTTEPGLSGKTHIANVRYTVSNPKGEARPLTGDELETVKSWMVGLLARTGTVEVHVGPSAADAGTEVYHMDLLGLHGRPPYKLTAHRPTDGLARHHQWALRWRHRLGSRTWG